jgi:hypothetical protein
MLQEKLNIFYVKYTFSLNPTVLEIIKGSKYLYYVIVNREPRSGFWITFLSQLLAQIEN